MAHFIEKFYNRFGGIDNRTNRLVEPPDTFRFGKNFVYDKDDNLAKRRGFGKIAGSAPKWGTFNYKYRDPVTGAQKERLIGLGDDGKLYELRWHYLKISNTSGSTVTMSFWYDSTNYKTTVNASTNNSAGSTTVDALKTIINAFAIVGVAATTIDENGTAVTSSLTIDGLEWMSNEQIATGSFLVLKAGFWQLCIAPDTSTPHFAAHVEGKKYNDYEGLIGVNLNNSAYLTDGGFPLRYDGYSAYRAGMPKVGERTSNAGTNANGFIAASTTQGAPLFTGMAVGQYKYKFKYVFTDALGAETIGSYDDIRGGIEATVSAVGPQNAVDLKITKMTNSEQFPIYYCIVNGAQNIPAGKTITVKSGHNIQVGMCLRLPTTLASIGKIGISYYFAKVTAVAATTITIQTNPTALLCPYYINNVAPTSDLEDDQVINAYYIESDYEDKYVSLQYSSGSLTQPMIQSRGLGVSLRVYRTAVGGSIFYHLIDLPVAPESSPDAYYFWTDTIVDSLMTSAPTIDDSEGNELPRACKYVSEWNNLLIQGGRPWKIDLGDAYYPGRLTSYVDDWGQEILSVTRYTENHLCDSQSVYWADTLNPEGFPQDGLSEDAVITGAKDQVKGIAPNKDAMFVFKNRSMALFTGDPNSGNVRKEILETDIGCASHKSIVDIEGALMFLDENEGFHTVIAGRLPIKTGYRVEKIISDTDINLISRLNVNRAVAANFKRDNLYVCFIPNNLYEESSTTQPDPDTSAQYYAFDYSFVPGKGNRSCWYIWKPDVLLGYPVEFEDNLFASFTSSYYMKRLNGVKDYSDATTAIAWQIATAWFNKGAPSIDKEWIKLIVAAYSGGFTLGLKYLLDYRGDELDYNSKLVGDYSFTFPSDFNQVKQVIRLLQAKGQALSLMFENSTIFEVPKINGWEIEFSGDFDATEVRT